MHLPHAPYLTHACHSSLLQELLANNNVVIIEPVRTKIERITSDKQPVISSARNPACKITGGAGLKLPNLKCDKNGLKRHFFYHPVRVNKELIDEELPVADTVRNVRKLFEGSSLLRVRSVSKDNLAVNTSTLAIQSALGSGGGGRHDNSLATALSSPSHGAQVKPAQTQAVPVTSSLAVDTSNGGQAVVVRPKWDAASLSSGVSSGELSSPCECSDLAGNGLVSIYAGDDTLDEGKCCDPSYVSQVVRDSRREDLFIDQK